MLKHEFVAVLNSLNDKELEKIKNESIKNIYMGNGKYLETALLEAVDNFVFLVNQNKKTLTDTQLEAGAYIPYFNQQGEG